MARAVHFVSNLDVDHSRRHWVDGPVASACDEGGVRGTYLSLVVHSGGLTQNPTGEPSDGSATGACSMKTAATLAATLFALPLASQPPAQRPSFPAGVEWVTVDAVVLDESGLPVRGLTAGDFFVKDEGVVQRITAFEAIEAPSAPPPQAVEPGRPGAPLEPLPRAAPPLQLRSGPRSSRAFVVVFDDLHIEHADVVRARGAVRAFTDSLADGDCLTLVTPGSGLWWQARIPESKAALEALLPRLNARPRTGQLPEKWMSDDEAVRIRDGDPMAAGYVERRWDQVATTIKDPDPELSIRSAAGRVSFDVQRRTRATLDVLVRALASLSGVRGRKSVMLVSGGFVRDTSIPEFATVLAESQRASAAIYFVDARGLAAVGPHLTAELGVPLDLRHALQDTTVALGALDAQSEASEGLAADTGGFSIRKTNDLGSAMAAVARESTAYYLLGFPVPAGARKDRFRRIDVQVSRPGVHVRARRGYYPSGGTKPSAADELARAVDSPFDLDGIPLRAACFVLGEKSRGRLRVLLTTDVDLRSIASESGTALDYAVAISGDNAGRQHSQEALRLPAPGLDGWRSFTRQALLAPGAYQARIVVRDAKSGRIGSLVQEFEVPQVRGLRISTPLLSARLRAAAGSGPAIVARRTFTRAGVLHGRFEVYGAAHDEKTPPSVKAGFLVRHADGTVIAAAGFTRIVAARDGTLGRNFGVPLDEARPGPYELLIMAEDETNGRRAEARATFLVEQPR